MSGRGKVEQTELDRAAVPGMVTRSARTAQESSSLSEDQTRTAEFVYERMRDFARAQRLPSGLSEPNSLEGLEARFNPRPESFCTQAQSAPQRRESQ